MTAYYNEIDPAAVEVLWQLIDEKVIAHGVVDNRSIAEIQPDDLDGFTQCHFFAGAGLWSVAARLAGWPDNRPLWTGSCPCQPFSVAGKGAGVDDHRHLWPDFFRLIRERRPTIVVGEQVAGTAGYGWLDGVRSDLAREDYASRGVDIPALAVDAPHIRQRLYWLAVADTDRCGRTGRQEDAQRGTIWRDAAEWADDVTLADSDGAVLALGSVAEIGRGDLWNEGTPARQTHAGSDLADADKSFRRVGNEQPTGQLAIHEQDAGIALRTRSRNGSFWSDAEWIICHDGKARRVAKSSFCDVAHGVSRAGDRGAVTGGSGLEGQEINYSLLVKDMLGRIDAWRITGNAIVPVLAAEVLKAFLEVEHDPSL